MYYIRANLVGCEFHPIFFSFLPKFNPFVPLSTRIQLIPFGPPPPVLEKTRIMGHSHIAKLIYDQEKHFSISFSRPVGKREGRREGEQLCVKL